MLLVPPLAFARLLKYTRSLSVSGSCLHCTEKNKLVLLVNVSTVGSPFSSAGAPKSAGASMQKSGLAWLYAPGLQPFDGGGGGAGAGAAATGLGAGGGGSCLLLQPTVANNAVPSNAVVNRMASPFSN